MSQRNFFAEFKRRKDVKLGAATPALTPSMADALARS